MSDIAVAYGMGNLRSVAKAIEHVAPNCNVVVTADPEIVRRAERVVFPGQGAMRDCMREIDDLGLRSAILDAAREKPFLGICIGLQMLFEHSEKENTPGLSLPAGPPAVPPPRCRAKGNTLRYPHMGGTKCTAMQSMWRASQTRRLFSAQYLRACTDLVAGYSLSFPFPARSKRKPFSGDSFIRKKS